MVVNVVLFAIIPLIAVISGKSIPKEELTLVIVYKVFSPKVKLSFSQTLEIFIKLLIAFAAMPILEVISTNCLILNSSCALDNASFN
jgi:hypothetical protein